MKSFTVRAENASSGASSELRRSPGSRRGPKRKIVPIPSASAAKTVDEDEDEDGALEYDRQSSARLVMRPVTRRRRRRTMDKDKEEAFRRLREPRRTRRTRRS
jgi:hypothetical protein